MPVKNILVALDGSSASDAALQGAVAMQQAYDAHLTGLVTVTDRIGMVEAGNRWIPPAIAKSIEQFATSEMSSVEMRYGELTQNCPKDKLHIIERAKGNDTTIAEASKFFDITVVGIPEKGSRSPQLQPDTIAVLSGRPVLAFPAGIASQGVARRAVIAWNGGRTAARAMGSAMRLLDTKEEVFVVSIGKNTGTGSPNGGLDPQTALQRQGLNAQWLKVPSGEGGIAGTLLAEAKKCGAELLVMGAYESSKFYEDIFGGVTHDVMQQTDIPVFLAH